MAPGILAQSILFSAIFYGIAIIWERDLGIAHKLLVTPAHRSALIMGKAFAAGLRGLVQAAVVYLVAIALHVEIRWEVMPMLTVAAGSSWVRAFSRPFPGHCLHRQDPRALHGDRSSADHAAVLRLECDLPAGVDARLAEGDRRV
jgi:hypothetical protein